MDNITISIDGFIDLEYYNRLIEARTTKEPILLKDIINEDILVRILDVEFKSNYTDTFNIILLTKDPIKLKELCQ